MKNAAAVDNTQIAAQQLVQSLVSMDGSNPVLEILPQQKHIVEGKPYPAVPLQIGGKWKVYYHCHQCGSMPAREHGHFHIFLNIDNAWTHVVALGMDDMGQACRWFCVNHWVTGESWCNADIIVDNYQIDLGACDDACACWLAAMLALYRKDILALIQQRDNRLHERLKQSEIKAGMQDLLQDRTLYQLSEHRIDLKQRLETVFGLG